MAPAGQDVKSALRVMATRRALPSTRRVWGAVCALQLQCGICIATRQCDYGHHGPTPSPPAPPLSSLPLRRPPAANRTFRSATVDRALDALLAERPPDTDWLDPDLATLLVNCLPNTLDTTVWQAPTRSEPWKSTFVSTGDIPAMWLRDSSNQVCPANHLS